MRRWDTWRSRDCRRKKIVMHFLVFLIVLYMFHTQRYGSLQSGTGNTHSQKTIEEKICFSGKWPNRWCIVAGNLCSNTWPTPANSFGKPLFRLFCFSLAHQSLIFYSHPHPLSQGRQHTLNPPLCGACGTQLGVCFPHTAQQKQAEVIWFPCWCIIGRKEWGNWSFISHLNEQAVLWFSCQSRSEEAVEIGFCFFTWCTNSHCQFNVESI